MCDVIFDMAIVDEFKKGGGQAGISSTSPRRGTIRNPHQHVNLLIALPIWCCALQILSHTCITFRTYAHAHTFTFFLLTFFM